MIPTIDLSPLSMSRPAPMSIAHAVGEAARLYGAFRVVGHGIPQQLIDMSYQTSREFFAWPLVDKMRYYIGAQPVHRGYVPIEERGAYQDENERAYESFDLGFDLPSGDPDSRSAYRLLGPNLWPTLHGFKDIISDYYERVAQVARNILTLLELYLGVSRGKLTKHMTRPISQLRLLNYLSPEVRNRDVEGVNMGAHTDYECLTLTHQSRPGLQVLTPSQEWMDVPAGGSALCVHIGDLLEVWSNGLLTSTLHRVVNHEESRQALVYFGATDYHVSIAPISSLLTPERPAQYPAIQAGAHLERMLRRDFPYLRGLDESMGRAQSAPTLSSFERRALTESER